MTSYVTILLKKDTDREERDSVPEREGVCVCVCVCVRERERKKREGKGKEGLFVWERKDREREK